MQLLDQREQLLQHIVHALDNLPDNERPESKRPESKRLIVGVAGAPASGKSTLARWLSQEIDSSPQLDASSVVVPMDGYHLDNEVLRKKQLLGVKGSPQSFDVSGFLALLHRLVLPASENPVYFPEFDRAMDLARCAANAVEAHHRVVIVEGNYLLLQRPIWEEIAPLLSLSIYLDVPVKVLENRLIKRWLDHGLSERAAIERARSNDIPNAAVVTGESTRAHMILKSMRQ